MFQYLERTGETLEALDRNNAQLERHLGEAEASLRTLEEEQENLGLSANIFLIVNHLLRHDAIILLNIN